MATIMRAEDSYETALVTIPPLWLTGRLVSLLRF